jgi:hypothetical protein
MGESTMTIKELKEHLDNYTDDDVVVWDIWGVEDVEQQAQQDGRTVTPEQCETVIEQMARYKDCTIGLNWDNLHFHLDEVLREAQDVSEPDFVRDEETHSPTCKGELRYYDGCLGYEAMRCDVCGFEQDLNAEANAKATAEREASERAESLRDDGRNPDGSGESYAERNQ